MEWSYVLLCLPNYASLSLVLFIRFFRESQKSKKFEVPIYVVLVL